VYPPHPDPDDVRPATAALMRSVLDAMPDDVSENDARRVHAFADYVTGLDLLHDLIVHELSEDDAWSLPGRIEYLVGKARNHLAVILGNGNYLATGKADQVDLRIREAMRLGFHTRTPVAKA
jgi:hypothetical protein